MRKLDLGCGRKKKDGCIGLDCQDLPGVDVVADMNERLPFDDDTFDEVWADNSLEHVRNDKRIHIMEEVWRVLKPGGIFYSSTPSTDGRGAFCDPTHYSFWNVLSFAYFIVDEYRELYGIRAKFKELDIYDTEPLKPLGIIWTNAKLEAVK